MSSTFSKKFKKIFKNPQTPLKRRYKTILIKNKNGLKLIVVQVLFFSSKLLKLKKNNDIK
jgi:hypothetical protein